MSACVSCGEPTVSLSRLCPPCITARTDAERTAQGLPLEPSAETMRRLAVVLARRSAA